MPRFRIYEKQVWISTYIVEAENKEAARHKYFDQDLPEEAESEGDEFSLLNVLEINEHGEEEVSL